MPLVFKWKMPLEGKKAIHESMKSELLTFRKDQKSHSKRKKYMLQTMEILVEVGDTTLPTPQTQNQQRSFYESI
jgi:predicted secreted acid phosphatase